MAYISASNVPIYFDDTVNSNALPGTADAFNRGVIASQVQLNYTPNIAPTRVVGKSASKESFNLAGPPNASLSFSAYVGGTAEFDISDYTGVQTTGQGFRIGDDTNGISGSGAYLTSYSLTVSPYAPVLFQADFAIYNPLTTTSAGGKIAAESADPLDDVTFGNFGHGVYSTFDKTNLSDVDIVESVTYSYSAQYLPKYTIGSYAVSGAELITAEHSFQIQGDNIAALVPITGSNPGALTLEIKNSTPSTLLTCTVDGRITAENVSLTAGDLARGSVTIVQPLV